MSQNTKESLWRSLVIAIVPLFFGSLLFSGILESYKNDASARKEVMNDFYRPMRETQVDCQKVHNNLFLKYAELAGSYQLMLNEFKHFVASDPSKMTKEYQVLLESMLSSNSKVRSDVQDLEGRLETCRTKLFRQYEELSLVTGTYKEFIKLANDRASKINSLYKKREATAQKAFSTYDAEKLMEMLRNLIQFDFETQEQKNVATQKVDELVNPIIQYYKDLSGNEQDMFTVDVHLFENLHEIFSTEISDRFERGFIARHFF